MMTKEEAIESMIESHKEGVKNTFTDFCDKYANCYECPLQGNKSCKNIVTNNLIERLLKAEEKKETNFDHYYDSKLAFDDFANIGDEKLIADIYTLCFKPGTDEVYKKSGIRDFKRWLLSPYKPPKYKLTQFTIDFIDAYLGLNGEQSTLDSYMFNKLQSKGYFKNVPADVPINDILANCEVIES